MKPAPDTARIFASDGIPASWTYSPDPEVEAALQGVRRRHPALRPAGLERPLRIMERLGNPHLKLQPVFHVAGTNGKGSVLAFLQAIFEAGGKTVHKFTSPHLITFDERIVVAGRRIEKKLLLSLIKECSEAAKGGDASFFEFFTGLAFLIYSRVPADAALLETGLGGLIDATNVIPESASTILTRISFDHQRLLGQALSEIAAHKAGIIKEKCPVVIAPQDVEVAALLTKAALDKQAPVSVAGCDWQAKEEDGRLKYWGRGKNFDLPLPALLGAHQVVNAGTAIAALEAAGYSDLLKEDVLSKAMQNVSWPGRLQQIKKGRLAKLLPKGWELWLDGAHNDSGAEALAAQVAAWGDQLPLHMITAFKKGKDARGFYRLLADVPETVHLAAFPTEVPVMPAEELLPILKEMGYGAVSLPRLLEDLIPALAFQFQRPGRILITGSLYLVGHALKIND